MADSATTRKRLRKQSLGSNTNTWGDTKLNEVLDAIDQSMDGYLGIALTGDVTLATTNYSVADQAKYRVHKYTGALTAAATVIYPSVEGWYLLVNAAGAVVTAKCAGGTGVPVPNGYSALVYGDGTDLRNGAPMLVAGEMTVAGQIHGVIAGTAASDAVNKTQMETALATAALPATAGTLLTSSGDATAGYLNQKITVSGSLTKNLINPGANEHIDIGVTVAPQQVRIDASDTTADYLRPKLQIGGNAGTVANPAGNEILKFPQPMTALVRFNNFTKWGA